ncbi:TPA: ash family protein [Enterobacter kobei]|nr:ash family protein [Enterobacter kobei]
MHWKECQTKNSTLSLTKYDGAARKLADRQLRNKHSVIRLFLTPAFILKYATHAAAKSAAGIATPDKQSRQRRASVLFFVVCTATPANYGGAYGAAVRLAGLPLPGCCNPVRLTTQ